MRLAIETGYGACSAALIDGVVAASRHEIIGRGHTERLVPLIGELIAEAGGALPGSIVVDVGPGSFTGLRVGIAAARALALVWNVPVTGFSSTALVAAAAFAEARDIDRITIAMEAGRGEVFVESFDKSLQSLSPPIAVRPDAAFACEAAVAGTGASMLAAAKRGVHIISDAMPDAAAVLLLPPQLLCLALAPIYVRAPDAKLPS